MAVALCSDAARHSSHSLGGFGQGCQPGVLVGGVGTAAPDAQRIQAGAAVSGDIRRIGAAAEHSGFQLQQTVFREDGVGSSCFFNLYAEYIMQNARLDETQDRIKISGRNINNLRYPNDTTIMAESKEE